MSGKKKNKKPEKKILYILFYLTLIVMFALAFMVRLWPLQTAHWWDEASYLQNAEVIYSGRNNYDEFAFRPPLLSIIFALGFVIKHHVFTASIAVALLGLVAPIFTFLIGKELYNTKTGFIAALIMSFTPFLVENSRFILTDVPSLSLICIGFYFLVIGDKYKKNYQYALSGLFFSLSVLMKFTSLILLFIIPLYFIVRKINFIKIIPFGLGFAISMLPYLIWAQIKQGFFLMPFILAQTVVSDTNAPLLFYFTNFLKAFPYIILIGFLLWLVPAIMHLILKICQKQKKQVKMKQIKREMFLNKNSNTVDFIFILWIILFLAYMTFAVPHKELRYIFPIALPLILLSSKGISSLVEYKNGIIKFASLIILILLSIISFAPAFARISQPFINTYQTEEMRASAFITNNYARDTLIYTNYNYPVFAYYSQMRILVLKNQDSSFYSVFPENMKEKGLLIIYRGIKDPSQKWIDSNAHFKPVKEFENIIIYEYSP